MSELASPSPAPDVERLLVLQGNDKGAEFALAESRLTIGSDTKCQVALSDPNVLGRHAVVARVGGVWYVMALDAAHPVEADGRFVAETRLDHGTTFRLGQTLFRFVAPRAALEGVRAAAQPAELDAKAAVARLAQARSEMMAQLGRIVLGQTEVLNQVLVAMFARGHVLLLGVPGLGKTLIVRALAAALDLDMKRIQFTPDLMPSDIIGTDILEEDPATRSRRFRFNRGPLFTNMLLADEINRTPPKTQAALLEAMQERKVTASGVTYDLPEPFMVLATQNPIEQEGTYPLPEAQLDRFMFCININYPAAADEQQIITETTSIRDTSVTRVLDAAAILQLQTLLRQIPVSKHVALYATRLIRATRPGSDEAPDFVSRWVRWGAGTRAGQYLLLAAKAGALFAGRPSVSCADIREFALPVMRHRLSCNFAAASEGVGPDDIVRKIMECVPEPDYK